MSDDAVQGYLVEAWLASLDEDVDVWHESPWAHIIFLIGQRLQEIDPDWFDRRLAQRLA